MRVAPGRPRAGQEVNVAIRMRRRVPAIWMRIIAVPSGIVAFRTLRVKRRSDRADLTIGTRYFRPGTEYLVTASPNRSLALGASDSFTLLPRRRGRLLPIVAIPPRGRGRPVARGEGVEPHDPAPPPEGTEAEPRRTDETRDGRPDSWRDRIRDRPPDAPTIEEERRRRVEQGRLPDDDERGRRSIERDRAVEEERRRREEGKKYDLERRVWAYVFATEDDARVCPRCRALGGTRYRPWQYRPAIPIHPNCRCHWERQFAPSPARRGSRRLAAALTFISGLLEREGDGKRLAAARLRVGE